MNVIGLPGTPPWPSARVAELARVAGEVADALLIRVEALLEEEARLRRLLDRAEEAKRINETRSRRGGGRDGGEGGGAGRRGGAGGGAGRGLGRGQGRSERGGLRPRLTQSMHVKSRRVLDYHGISHLPGIVGE